MIKLNVDIRQAIEATAAKFALDADLVEAIVFTESSGRPDAKRYEQNFYTRYVIPMMKEGSGIDEEMGKELATSWGLMQVMGLVAYEYGLKHDIRKTLCTVDGGLWYGCMHLARFIKKYGNENDAIASYNAGSPRKKNGEYVNQVYVDKVNKYRNELKA